jgi:hypothetical protein
MTTKRIADGDVGKKDKACAAEKPAALDAAATEAFFRSMPLKWPATPLQQKMQSSGGRDLSKH